MSLRTYDKRAKKGIPPVFLVIPVLILLTAVALGVILHEGEAPQIQLNNEPDYLGSRETISLIASDRKSGIRSIEVILSQGEKESKLFEKSIDRQGYFSKSGPNQLESEFEIDIKALGFAEGDAALAVTVRDFSWRGRMKGNLTTYSRPVVIDTKPPLITIQDSTRYIKNGGAGVVVYRTNEPVLNHGVVMNDHFHPGHPLPGRENTYVAYVAVPFNAGGITSSHLTAADQAGNVAQAAVGMTFRKKTLKRDSINISDDFLSRKLPEFGLHYQLEGTPVEQFLAVNNQVRQENDRLIAEICSTSLSERLWKGVFSRMARSSQHAGFADHRTYFYQGKKIDEQFHLGIDLASVRHAAVEAVNRGRVVFADFLGIYGNMVILDHGKGVFTLYSHLNQITVSKGDMVDAGAILGQTGTSGMAGGDHLHFSVLINGVFVDPVEWWDPNWLRVSIDGFL
jgi:murein DD-endopeptidase MepM/ murein hydrolase activator NlpD